MEILELKYFDTFRNVLLEETYPIFTNKKLLELKGNKYKSLTPKRKRIVDVFWALGAIAYALKSMRMSLRYIEVASRRPQDIKTEEHIRYHYESFIQSAYILREKLKLVLPKIYKVNGKWVGGGKAINEKIRKQLNSSFTSIERTRGIHVHDSNPYHDPDASHAEMMSTLQENIKDNPEWAERYEDSLYELKFMKKLDLEKNIKNFENVIEGFFNAVCKSFIIDEKLKLPC